MTVTRPIRRTCRQFIDGQYTEGGRWRYMIHPKFAKNPENFVRSFLLLQQDLIELFTYIEPSDTNSNCYSFRIHSLLLRACIEVEANCKTILIENGYPQNDYMNMNDYKKIEHTHLLSQYEVLIPYWNGTKSVRKPFEAWGTASKLPWYSAYNATKHDKYQNFKEAKFDYLLDAVCGVLVLLSSQFETNDFSTGNTLLAVDYPRDGMESGIGGYFRVKFPQNWPTELRYDFKWQDIEAEEDPFGVFDYTKI